MGKYFKDQDHSLPKKRFKSSNLSNAQNIREASSLSALLGAFSKSAIIFNKVKNFFWTFNKISKQIKLDPKIVNNLETSFNDIAKVHADKYAKQKTLVADLLENYDNLPNNAPNKSAKLDELEKAKVELTNIETEGMGAIRGVVDDFNAQTRAPIFLEFSGGLKDPKLDFGLLSQGAGDAIDVEALRKALVIMREVNPDNPDPIKGAMSFLRGGLGMVGDATRPLRNISGDLTIKNLMGKRYTFFGPLEPNTQNRVIKEYSLSDILEITAKTGKFNPPAGFTAQTGAAEAIATDFKTLIARTEVAQSGIKDPKLLTGISLITTLFAANLSAPYWVPLASGISSMTSRITNPEGNVKEQQKANEKIFGGDNNTTDNPDLGAALSEKITNDIQYFQNKLSTETDPIFARQYQLELNRLNRKLERLNAGK